MLLISLVGLYSTMSAPKIETEIFFMTLTGLGLYLIDNDNKENALKIVKTIEAKFTK